MRKILILGDYSGNNAGHNALLVSIIHEIESLGGDFRFFVPTIRPRLLRRVVSIKDNIVIVGIAPWDLSVKFLSLRMFALVKEADCILFTDNLFYDSALFNPFKNNLFSLFILTRYARHHLKPLIYYNGGVGPLKTSLGRLMVKEIATAMDVILLRDSYSKRLLDTICREVNPVITADSGFNISEVSYMTCEEESTLINRLDNKAWIGVNLSYHVLKRRYLKLNLNYSVEEIIFRLSEILRFVACENDCGLILYITHPKDSYISDKIKTNIKRDVDVVLVDQSKDAFKQAMPISLKTRLTCFIGTRYHEMIMFSSIGVPIIGIDCGDKTRVLFEDVFDCPELLIELDKLLGVGGEHMLKNVIYTAYKKKDEFFKKVQLMKKRAYEGATILKEYV